jgi:rhomboid protease GluP
VSDAPTPGGRDDGGPDAPAPIPGAVVDPGVAFEEAGYVPPDPDEPPPAELWRMTQGVLPWGTLLVLLAWGTAFAWLAANGEIGDAAAVAARGANLPQTDARDAAWRLLASTFLHAGPSHVFFNALTMLVFGPAVERVYSRWGFWILYAFGGAIASLGSLLWRLHAHGAGSAGSIGASGAIFALGGALLAAAYRLRHLLAVGRARAFAAVILLLAMPALAAGFERQATDNAAHATGLLAGLALGAAVPLDPRVGGPRPGTFVRVLGALAALALAAAFARVLVAG